MTKDSQWTVLELLLLVSSILFVLLLQGAIPFLMTPTLWQAVWTAGFAQSFANGPWYSLYTQDFGFPNSNPIAFGLAGAWPMSWLLRCGFSSADAYSGMVALWSLVAFASAYIMGRRFGSRRSLALLGAIVWMSMPIIWVHAGYSMVSLGMGLLPFYLLAYLDLFWFKPETQKITLRPILVYFFAAIIAAFMDGYTFLMFAAGSSILWIFQIFSQREMRSFLLRFLFPIHAAAFAFAYALLALYLGRMTYESHPLDFFRGWGLDLSFIVIPTQGIHWLLDTLGLSIFRTNQTYFGDASVWTSTFSLPILLAGLYAWWRGRRETRMATGVLLVALFGFYMSLGPSLKMNSTKPESLQRSCPGNESSSMPASLAIMPTGNGWISENLPGFKVMRAAYRWTALEIVALWILVMLVMSRSEKKRWWIGILLSILILNLPPLPRKWRSYMDHRTMFYQIDQNLISELRERIPREETVAFLPAKNDFFANYLAPKVGFLTYNIGGDKNLAMAQTKWPAAMLALSDEIDPSKVDVALKMLIEGHADTLVVPYFHMLWATNLWPSPEETTARLSPEQKATWRSIPGFVSLQKRKDQLRPFLTVLSAIPWVVTEDARFFTTIRLHPDVRGKANRGKLLVGLLSDIQYPLLVGSTKPLNPWILKEGWHLLEPNQVWSTAKAKLMLAVPPHHASGKSLAILQFNIFGASPQRPVFIHFSSQGEKGSWKESLIATSSQGSVAVPLNPPAEATEISISVDNATSPQVLMGWEDGRILGIALYRIDLVDYP